MKFPNKNFRSGTVYLSNPPQKKTFGKKYPKNFPNFPPKKSTSRSRWWSLWPRAQTIPGALDAKFTPVRQLTGFSWNIGWFLGIRKSNEMGSIEMWMGKLGIQFRINWFRKQGSHNYWFRINSIEMGMGSRIFPLQNDRETMKILANGSMSASKWDTPKLQRIYLPIFSTPP